MENLLFFSENRRKVLAVYPIAPQKSFSNNFQKMIVKL